MAPSFLFAGTLTLASFVERHVSFRVNATSALMELSSDASTESREPSQRQRRIHDSFTSAAVKEEKISWFTRDNRPQPGANFSGFFAVSQEIVWTGRVRKDTREGSVQFDWSGTKMSFGVVGKPSEVWIKMNGQSNYFNVHVDGELVTSFFAKSRARYYRVVQDLNRDATIELVKRSEAKTSWVMQSKSANMMSVVLPPLCRLVKPEIRSIRKIEFIGDSDSAGFGNLAPRSHMNLMGLLSLNFKHEDVEKAWIGFVARAFQADMHGIAISGIGAQWDFFGNSYNNMRKFYERTLYADGNSIDHMESVDLVVVYLGGNDWTGVLSKDESKEAQFVNGYAQLLEIVATRRPNTPVICIGPGETKAASLKTQEEKKRESDLMNQLIREAVKQVGSKDIFFEKNYVSFDWDDNSQWGNLDHWSVKGHARFAHEAISIISKHTKWNPIDGWERVRYALITKI